MNTIIEKLGYNGVLLSLQEVVHRYPNYQNLESLGVDQFYFIGGHPAAMFYMTDRFDNEYSKDIAEVLHRAWNYNKILLLIAYSDFEVRVYNCHSKPYYVSEDSEYEKEIEKAQISEAQLADKRFNNAISNNESDLETFTALFSREALDTGALWRNYNIRKKIDISKRVDAYLADSLNRTQEALEKEGLDEQYIHSLLIRSLFILFLEDKGATVEAGIYTSVLPGSKSYFDILKDKNATYRLFSKLSEHFKGDITNVDAKEESSVCQAHLNLIRKCFLDGDLSDNPKMYDDWRLFKFDIIRVELLSEIYEIFLGKSKAQKGQFYTPANLVDLILDELLPLDSLNWKIKILDPACGSGIFLVKGYKRLIWIWKKEHNTAEIDFDTLKYILCNYIYGIDIDFTALSVASFSLYLALVDELNPRTLWSQPNKELPYLIHVKQGNEQVNGNLWCEDTIATDFSKLIPKVDLIVGNPPYGTRHKQASIKKYCKEHQIANEMSLPFIQKAASFCPDGRIALVVNMKILTNTNGTYCKFREWLLKCAYIEKVYNFSIFRKATNNYGGSLFSSATTPVAVLFYKANRPANASHSVIYWAPRTYVKSNVLSDIVFDSCDIKYLPRELCEEENSYIWKIGAWGNRLSLDLVDRLLHLPNLSDTFKQNGWVYGRGCNADSKHRDFVPDNLLSLDFTRYSINSEAKLPNFGKKAFRINKPGIFTSPYVIMKECPDREGIIAGIYNGEAITTTSAFVFNGMSYEDKVVLVCFLNSKLVNVFLFLIASTWGVERERIELEDETMKLPSPYAYITDKQKRELLSLYEQICSRQSNILQTETDYLRKEIDTLFYNIFNLSDLDVEVVDDVYSNSLRLFSLKEKSEALKPTRDQDLSAYADRLCKTLNDYYQYSNIRVSPSILLPDLYDPLNMVIIEFGNMVHCITKSNSHNDKRNLSLLYNSQSANEPEGAVIQRVFRVYGEDQITLIKPSQRRYWSIMQALEDASSIFSEILSMQNQSNG